MVRPALRSPRGEARVRALFERWLAWGRLEQLPGGCIFAAASMELDDRPGPVRDRLVRSQRDLLDTVSTVFRTGVDEGQFRKHADPKQFAQDLFGVMLAYYHASRLLRDASAERRARAALEALIAGARR